jgi:hypothetical protein
VVTLHRDLFARIVVSRKIAKARYSSRRPVAGRRAGTQSIF